MDVWHNPRCGKSRQCITYLKENNYEFNTILYLNEPISKDRLIEIVHVLGIRPIDLVRKNEPIFKEQFKNNASYTNHGVLPHEGDPSGKSKGSWHTFDLNDGSGIIYLECMDWAEDTGKWDNLRVTIFNKEFNNFLQTEAY